MGDMQGVLPTMGDMQGVLPTMVHPGIYHHGTPSVLPGIHRPPAVHASSLHVTDPLIHGVWETAWAQRGRFSWVGGGFRLKVVNPVEVGGRFCAEFSPLSHEKE